MATVFWILQAGWRKEEDLRLLVLERAADLARTSEQLRAEVADRGRVADALRAQKEKYRHLVEQRRELENQEAQLREQLHEVQKLELVAQLAAGVVHDFNNLLTVIKSGAESARHALTDSRGLGDIDLILQAAEQATGVTRSLLVFMRHVPIRPRPVNLSALLPESARMIQRLLPAAVQLAVEANCDEPLWVRADPTQLQQVLLNLAINARDAMPMGGTISISASPCADVEGPDLDGDTPHTFVCLRVRDTGVGIASEDLERIFQPFYTTKEPGKGTGLGLAIVRSIVEEHAGEIAVSSTPGVGSDLSVRLPGIASSHDHLPATGMTDPPTGWGELILVAEDHDYVRGIIASGLQELGYQTMAYADGLELMQAFHEHRKAVRLAILDHDLPSCSGSQIVTELRSSGARIPTVLITGRPEEEPMSMLDDHTQVLPKPFLIAELAELVHRLLHAGARPETMS